MRRQARQVRQRVTAVIGLSLALWVNAGAGTDAQDQLGPLIEVRADLAQRFEVGWKSVVLSASVLNDPESREEAVSCPQWTFSVIGQIRIIDCNDLAGVGVSPTEVVKVTGPDGNDVKLASLANSAAGWRSYRKLDYYPGVRHAAEPCDFSISLELDPNQPVPSSLTVEGYICTLYAEDLIEIEVPFRASEEWFQSTADLQTRVLSAGLSSCVWGYHTVLKSTTASLGGIDDRLGPEQRAADYIVLEVQLIALSDPNVKMSVSSSKIIGGLFQTGGYVVDCLGSAADRGYPGVKTVRHIIAVHPVEVRIPFVLRDIPVPSLPPVGR